MSNPTLLTTRTIHQQTYEFYPWQQLGQDVFTLSQQLLASGKSFDRIIALAKGGLTFSRSLVDYLEVEALSSIQIQFYSDIGQTNKLPVITQSLPVSIKGERVLIFDDILDSGETLKLATQYLGYHGAAEITTAVLIEKPWSTHPVDFSVRSSEAWIIFPNEVRETIKSLTSIWQKAGDSSEKISAQLLEIGFSKDEVAFFTNFK